jgi:hypothetical protein
MNNVPLLLFAFVVLLLLLHTGLPGKLAWRVFWAPWRWTWRHTLGRRGR